MTKPLAAWIAAWALIGVFGVIAVSKPPDARAQTSTTSQATYLIRGLTGAAEGTSFMFPKSSSIKTHHAFVSGTGAVTATIVLRGNNDCSSNWVTLATFTLSGTTRADDAIVTDAPYVCFSANLTAITGTSAAATLVTGL